MKNLFFALVTLFVVSAAKGQTASETTFRYNKADQPAFYIELNYPPDVVEEALKKHLKESVGTKGNESRDVRAYKGVSLPQLSSDKLDVYTSVERKSKKEKDRSVVYLMISRGNDVFVSGSSDADLAQKAKDFLNSFMGTAAAYNHEVQVKEQEEVVRKAQKKLDGYKEDVTDYEKKIAEYQRKIEERKRDIANQEAVLQSENKALETLRNQKQ